MPSLSITRLERWLPTCRMLRTRSSPHSANPKRSISPAAADLRAALALAGSGLGRECAATGYSTLAWAQAQQKVEEEPPDRGRPHPEQGQRRRQAAGVRGTADTGPDQAHQGVRLET